MDLLPEARMMVPDFWTICTHFVSHPVLHLDKSWRWYHWQCRRRRSFWKRSTTESVSLYVYVIWNCF